MSNNRTILAIVLLIAGLIIGGGIGYFTAPQPIETIKTVFVPPMGPEFGLKNAAVKIGYIASDTTALEVGKPYHEQIIAADLNNYSKLLGYGTTFTYICDDAQGQASTHLEKVQGLRSAGITVFEGGGLSSQVISTLSYCNANGMLMWSASSTSPHLATPNDDLYRMCPADSHLAPALVDIMWAAGVKSIVIFQRGDSWADDIVYLLTPIWSTKGGEISGNKVRYATNATDFSNYLSIADQEVKDAVASYGGETQRVGVVILASNEISTILDKVSNYPSLYGVHWWGSTPEIQRVLNDTLEVASHIGLYSLSPRETITPLYTQLETRYANLTKQKFNVFNAYSYDISLVLVNSMYQVQSSSGVVLVPLQKPIADQTFGSAGSCRLDESGDRIGPSYDVWSYRPYAANVIVRVVAAQFSPDAEEISANHGTEFYPLVLGYTPIGP